MCCCVVGIIGFLSPLLTGPTLPARQRTIDGALDPLSTRACNAHLVVLILDRVLLTLFPEMGVGGPPDGWWESQPVSGGDLDGEGEGEVVSRSSQEILPEDRDYSSSPGGKDVVVGPL